VVTQILKMQHTDLFE
jgi:phage/conjugal plasmid C-4 type zinc finger TraR family protein